MSTDSPATRAALQGRPLPYATTSGMLLAAAALPWGILHDTTASLGDAPRWLQGVTGALSAATLLAAVAIVLRPRVGRLIATIAVLGALALGAPHLMVSPLAALGALVASTATLVLLWKVGSPLLQLSRVRRRPLLEGGTQGTATMALWLWLFWALADPEKSLVDTLVVGWALAWSVLYGVVWCLRRRRSRPVASAAVGGSLLVAAALAASAWGDPWWMVSPFLGPAAVTAVALRPPTGLSLEESSWWEILLGHPERLFVGTFAALCLAGTVLLALPRAAASGESIGLVDAAFTSTSSVCVTGLIVLDTPVDFSPFGQAVLLALIQIGGLGIMTFSTAALWILGRRMSLRHEGAVASLLSTEDRSRLFATVAQILQLTLWVEGAGALLLTLGFLSHGDGLGMATWRGVFTAISAFCNAGFALQSESLIPYQGSPIVLHTVALLIIVGGLSPLAVFSLPAIVKRSPRPVTAQARLILVASAVLLVVGFAYFLAFEWDRSLGHLGPADRFHNAWFQSVTLRTAGFNSVDLSVVRPATFTLLLAWMFIGGSPGGTAGGIKTTTAAVLLVSVVQAMRGRWTLELFAKRIPDRTRAKAAVVAAIAIMGAILALLCIQVTQDMPTELAVFEVVSALGTVGLTVGGTPLLDGIGKTIIIACMFVGRVGGLTMLMLLRSRRAPPTILRPEEAIDVG